MSSPGTCAMCCKPNAKACGNCHATWYFSRECQSSDWPTHKLLCKQFRDQGPRPSADHYRAIVLPVEDTGPKLVWHAYNDGAFSLHDDPDLKGPMTGVHSITRNRRGDVFKDNVVIFILHDDCFQSKGLAINKSLIKAVAGTRRQLYYFWQGPVCLSRRASYADDEKPQDMSLADYRHALDEMCLLASAPFEGGYV
ncbi:hypothetical protein F5Y15DRAFT_414203 [Xylariaceae sp. FL0016]|nr:hypothetical protein F5Y15DRAFT_414203 [Xylariaceae sp. FL0016]